MSVCSQEGSPGCNTRAAAGKVVRARAPTVRRPAGIRRGRKWLRRPQHRRLSKVVTFEQQRDTIAEGQCEHRAIAEIQPGGMPSLTKTKKRLTRGPGES